VNEKTSGRFAESVGRDHLLEVTVASRSLSRSGPMIAKFLEAQYCASEGQHQRRSRGVIDGAPNSQSDKMRYIRALLRRRIDENRRVEASRWNRFVFLIFSHGVRWFFARTTKGKCRSTGNTRSPLVSVARSGQWRDPGQQKAGLSTKHEGWPIRRRPAV